MHPFTRIATAVLCATIVSPALGAFTNYSTPQTSVTTVMTGGIGGIHTANGAFRINTIQGDGTMITTATDPLFKTAVDNAKANNSWPIAAETFSTVYSGPSQFRVYLVSSRATDNILDFDVQFHHQVLGVVATTDLTLNGFGPLGANLIGDFYSATTVSGTLNTANSGKNALEILPYNNDNPDSLTIAGNRVSGRVGTVAANQELFYVLTAVPEPTTFAVWGLCGLGVVVAGRRRMRCLAA